ncbi:MAG: FAD-dependent monooxygenase [Actinomycetota bacterium]|nr:FAD-dependent monooxygenase [Actinomycetota bacterium]
MQRQFCDVLVVGAGPAGLTAATALARHGIDVLVVERHAGTSPFPKATGVSTRTMELLRSWGLEQRVRAGAMHVRPGLAVSDTLTGTQRDGLEFGYPTDAQALAVSPTTPCYCPQDHLEPVLLTHLRARGGRVRFGTELADCRTEGTGVQAELRDHATGRTERVQARYLIGADGPRSSVRSMLGLGVDDFGTIGEFVAVTFRADLTRRLPRVPSVLNAVEVAGAGGLFVPTSTDDRWIYGREWYPDGGESIADWTPRRCTEVLRVATGLPDLRPEILTVMPFAMGGHVATVFRAGRAFLVGDAAHRTTPVGGIGMNTAIHGAHNLGWKLAWVLRGWGGETLLDSYEAERRPIGTENVLRSLHRAPALAGDGLAGDIGVHYTSAVVEAATGTGTGERASHAWMRRGGHRISTLDLFDGRLTVLTGPRGEPWRRAVAEIAGNGLPIVALTMGRDLDAEDGTFARHYRLGDTGAALVRPDGYLVWRRPGPGGDARAALQSAVGLALGRAAEAPALLRQAG